MRGGFNEFDKRYRNDSTLIEKGCIECDQTSSANNQKYYLDFNVSLFICTVLIAIVMIYIVVV